jgi:hypothetical protein
MLKIGRRKEREQMKAKMEEKKGAVLHDVWVCSVMLTMCNVLESKGLGKASIPVLEC